MTVFATMQESHQLGGPVLSLFRTALGRDPDVHELAEGVRRLRAGAAQSQLAAFVLALPEARRRHDGTADPDFVAALCRNAFGSEAPAAGAAAMGAALGGSRAEILATLAALSLARGRVPLLPGIAPGATPDDPVAYALWLQEYGAADDDGEPVAGGPCIGVALRAGDTQTEAALRTVASLRAQHYEHWRLHLALPTRSPWSTDALARLCDAEPRVIRVEPGRLWEAWLAAPAELACRLLPGDRLPPGALATIARAFTEAPDTALLYTDEDVEVAGLRQAPRFKPAHSPDGPAAALVGELTVYRTTLLAGLDPAESLDRPAELPSSAAARAVTRAGVHAVRHLPGILIHRADPRPPFAPPAHTVQALPSPAPEVTILVLTRDRAALLEACLRTLLERTTYPAYTVLIVDNGSAEPDALALLEALAQEPRVRVLRRPGPFNFAAPEQRRRCRSARRDRAAAQQRHRDPPPRVAAGDGGARRPTRDRRGRRPPALSQTAPSSTPASCSGPRGAPPMSAATPPPMIRATSASSPACGTCRPSPARAWQSAPPSGTWSAAWTSAWRSPGTTWICAFRCATRACAWSGRRMPH